MLIDKVGLPKDGDEDFFTQLYRTCDKELIPDPQKWNGPLQDYERRSRNQFLPMFNLLTPSQAGPMSRLPLCAVSILWAPWAYH